MKANLIIIPSCIKNRPEIENDHKILDGMFQGDKEYFYYDGKYVLELKKLLMENSYRKIIIGYPSLDDDFVRIQMVRSLAMASELVIYAPDTSFIKKVDEMQCGEYNELAKWYRMGKSIQCNIYRQADVIIAKNDEDKMLLRQVLSKSLVICVNEIKNEVIKKTANRKVSIIMLTFNQKETTIKCIESLKRNTEADYELIIVDNGSNDGTREYLNGIKKEQDNIKLIFNEKNIGFAKANNQGIVLAEGEYILLLNNDVLLTKGWLNRLIACAESDPEIGVVGPCTNKAVGQQVVDVQIEMEDQLIQKYAYMQLMKNAGNWFETHRIIGFCMIIKKEVIERVGMLDERFGPGGFEDYDFCLRVKQAGYKVMIASDVFIYHIGGQGYSNNDLDYDKLRHQNVQIFIEKWCRRALEVLETIP